MGKTAHVLGIRILNLMAQSIGGKIRGAFVAVLVGLLVLAFAVWGVNDIFVPGVRNAVVSVGDASVSTRDFNRDLQSRLREIAAQRGEGLTNEEAYQQGVHRDLMAQYQVQLAVEKDAQDLGVGVNRADAKSYIEAIPAFRSEITQEFDRNKLETALARTRNGYTIKKFEEDILRDLRRVQTVEAIVGGVQAPSGYAKRQFDFLSEQRKATVLTLNKDAVPTPETPSDEVLQAYLDQNAVRYTAPEYRQVTMIRLEPSGFLPDVAGEITEQDVQDEFDSRVARGTLGTKASRDVVVLTAPDQATAQDAATRLAAGEDPTLVASALGLVSPDRFDGVEKNQLLDSVTDDVAFDLSEGEARASENSLGGWEAVYVPSVTAASLPVFSSIEPEIRRSLGEEKAKSRIFDISNDMDTRLINGDTLEAIATELDLPMESYDYIDRVGQTQDGLNMNGSSRIPGIAQDDELLRLIFTEDIGFDTDIYPTNQDGVVAFRVTDVIDSQVRPLNNIKDQVLTAWKNEQIQESLTERGLALAQEIRDGKSLEDIAEELGSAATIAERGISRAQPPRDIAGSVVVDLLTSDPGDLARGTGAVPLTYTLARLDSVTPNSDGLAGEILDTVQSNIGAEISGDIQNAYRLAILKEHELREYPDQVRAVMGIEGE
ncbi:MAG: SurA N-terminal domain-containing protein [Litorimonas sp.]